jgi:hypothetical protein
MEPFSMHFFTHKYDSTYLSASFWYVLIRCWKTSVLGSARITFAACAETVGSPPECYTKSPKTLVYTLRASYSIRTHQYPVTQNGSHVDVGNARIDVHTNRLPILHEYLLEEHVTSLACLHEGIRHEVSLRSVGAVPAKAEAFFLWCAPLD